MISLKLAPLPTDCASTFLNPAGAPEIYLPTCTYFVRLCVSIWRNNMIPFIKDTDRGQLMSSWRLERSLAGSRRRQALSLPSVTWRSSAVPSRRRLLRPRSRPHIARSSRYRLRRRSHRPEYGRPDHRFRRESVYPTAAADAGGSDDEDDDDDDERCELISRQDYTVDSSNSTWQCLCMSSHYKPQTRHD